MGLQRFLNIVYPPGCISCGAHLDEGGALCNDCWSATRFVSGLVCDACGTPLPGELDAGLGGEIVHCDDCMRTVRPWQQGRAALIYAGNSRRLVLALKHGDRQDLARPLARWMVAAAGPLLARGSVVVPIPVHWQRLLKRRYNQAALLADQVARQSDAAFEPRALVRPVATKTHDGMGLDARFKNMSGAILAHKKHGQTLAGKDVVLVDDVMTSGATLAAATEACHAAGAARVCILVLARVAKDA